MTAIEFDQAKEKRMLRKINFGSLALLLFLLIGLVSVVAEKNRDVTINWDGPPHLLADFEKQKACSGLQALVGQNSNRFTIHVRPGHFARRAYWAVLDPEGKLVKAGSTMRAKNAIKDACKVIRKIEKQKIRAR